MAQKQNNLTVNSFEGGMNQDLSKLVSKKSIYFYAKNFRPFVDEEGQGLGGTINTIGNKLDFAIPDTNDIWDFRVAFTAPFPNTVSLTVFIAGTPFNDVFSIAGINPSELRDSLVLSINGTAHYYNNNIIAAPFGIDGIIIVSAGTVAASFTSSDPNITNLSIKIAGETGLKIIGWTNIRGTFVLFTTPSEDEVPTGTGQLWILKYDEVTEVPTIKLVYNNRLKLSTEYPIEAIGRYETSNIQKVYWTDNYNRVRSLNVESNASLGLSPEEINLSSNIRGGIPVITSMGGGGALKTGIYQYAYRLSTQSGSESGFSRLSRQVHIHDESESSTNFWEYVGVNPDLPTNKSITGLIEDVDLGFDYIEVVALFRTGATTTPIITSFITEIVPTDGVFTFTHTGSEADTFEITMDEALLNRTIFSRAKTLTSKDNRLFVGNVSRTTLDIDLDTRAYGFDRGTHQFSVDGTVRDLSTSGNWTDIANNANAINDDFDTYKFKRNTSTYGGSGPYIDYQIETEADLADVRTLGYSPGGYDQMPFYNDIDAPLTNPVDLGEGRTYPQFTSMADSYKNNITFGLKRGYMRDETYRMGIVFFDKEGNAGFAHWIADVKIPPSFDPARSTYGGNNYDNFPFSGKLIFDVDPGGDTDIVSQWFNKVRLSFYVNLPIEVLEQISGYSIVRMKRLEVDKSVLGQGLAIPMASKVDVDYTGGASQLRTSLVPLLADQKSYMFPYSQNSKSSFANVVSDTNSATLTSRDAQYFNFITPEYALADTFDVLAGDYIQTVDTLFSKYNVLSSSFRPLITWAEQGDISIRKYYDSQKSEKAYTNNAITTVIDGWKLADKSVVNIDNGIVLCNEVNSVQRTTSTTNEAWFKNWGFGGKSIFLKVDTPIHDLPALGTDEYTSLNPAFNSASDFHDKYISTPPADGENPAVGQFENLLLVNYKRNLIKQYNGNTFANRSSNKYISTGHFVAVHQENLSAPSFSTVVWGGDTFLGIHNQQMTRKVWDWETLYPGQPLLTTTGGIGVSGKLAVGVCFPAESALNFEMRGYKSLGGHGLSDTSSSSDSPPGNSTLVGSVDNGEDYRYLSMYSAEDDIITYFNKPLNFVENNDYDTRIYASDPKVNGEPADSWSYFRPLEFIDVESRYGPINKILTHNDSFFSFQDDGISSISVSPRVSVQGSDGVNIEIGTGEVLQDYTYITTLVGSKHQWGVITSKNNIYWIDVLSKKMYRLSSGEGVQALSDAKGMNSFFKKNLEGLVTLDEKKEGDNPLKFKGITGFYDDVNDEVVFIVSGAKRTHSVSPFSIITFDYVPGDWIIYTYQTYEGGPYFTSYYLVTDTFLYTGTASLAGNTTLLSLEDYNEENYYALGYHELGEYFTSFYDIKSTLFPHKNRVVISPSITENQDVYRHNRGNRGTFYGTTYDASIKFIVNPIPLTPKVFGNMEWASEVTTSGNVDVPLETFASVLCETEYQTTGNTPLIAGTNVKRKERAWRFAIPRNANQSDRLRDKHMAVTYIYDNTLNNRILLHGTTTSFTPSSR